MDLIGDGAEAEIGDLQVAVLVEEEILRLEVPVENAARVAVPDGGDELPEILPAEILAESALGDPGEELPALDELHDEIDLGLGGQDLEELDDVGVVEAAHDGDLALDVSDQGGAGDLLLIDHFDRDALPVPDVPGMVDFGEGAATQELPDLVFLEQGVVVGGGWPAAVLFHLRHLRR
ncbi:unnamed protein product [Cuscuta epithymum]|uniref:Uncharacterized protein n=1 Tax=Cuscuta epithymum TaxID=186058 RepID=A0AAV0F1G6_9ASTE|nr:unnamed protein product [Cuscuta epithymum]